MAAALLARRGVCAAALPSFSAASVVATSSASATPRRALSLMSSFPFGTPAAAAAERIEFPRVARGLDYDLNWSLAADSLTTRGEAYRNASVRDLLEFAGPRGAVSVTKERALELAGGAAAPLAASPAPAASSFSTDVLPGRSVMDVEEYEDRLASLRDECLSFAPRLFVEDACVGSTRASEVRVRLVTDSPVVALYFRSLLQRTPLYSPEAFPRTLTVLVATLAAPEGVAAARGKPGPYTVVDVDPLTARGTVLAVGAAPLTSVAEALAAAAAQLMAVGGYRHVAGGSQNSALAAARADGTLAWYLRDGHNYAPKDAPHPDLLALPRGADVVRDAAGGSCALVIGAPAGAVSAPAAAAGRLFAAQACVWQAEGGLAAFWAGLSVPAAQQRQHAQTLPLVRGSLVAEGLATLPLGGAQRAAPHSTRVVLVGAGGEAAAAVKAACGLTDKQAEKFVVLLAKSGAKVEVAADAAAARKLLGL